MLTQNKNALLWDYASFFLFLGKQSTWNYKLQFLCSANNTRLEVNNAATVTENKIYLLEQTSYLLISANIKALKTTAKREKATLFICKLQILQVLL